MSKQMIWLSYDLGVRGDYVGLYNWLDAHDAKESGEAIAVFTYKYEGRLDEALLADLKATVDFDNRTRFYVIYQDEQTNKTKGKFLAGRRRASAWVGYAPSGETADDEFVP